MLKEKKDVFNYVEVSYLLEDFVLNPILNPTKILWPLIKDINRHYSDKIAFDKMFKTIAQSLKDKPKEIQNDHHG